MSSSNKLRVLVISKEAWRDEQNGGNVLSNIFASLNAEFAQIYCTDTLPNNSLCRSYFQITDRMMLDSLLGKGRAGKRIDFTEFPHSPITVEGFSGAKGRSLETIRVARELLWAMGKYDREAIFEFIDDFSPNIVFAPCYGNHYMVSLIKLISKRISVPIVSYISDDFYTNRQLRLSPVYWINHFILRRHVREAFSLYDLVYTMTDEQKEQCEHDFGANMKILRKSGSFDCGREKRTVHQPVRIIYAGGIYLNRWKTLAHLAEAIKAVNTSDVRFVLDIYTSTVITDEMRKKLEIPGVSSCHAAISLAELKRKYEESDIALHVEGFDLVNRFKVRMSFSTKIVDCLDSGCAVMAICDKRQAGYSYLKKYDAAICIDNPRDIQAALEAIVANPDLLIEYQAKAFDLGRRNHIQARFSREIEHDFTSLAFCANRKGRK